MHTVTVHQAQGGIFSLCKTCQLETAKTQPTCVNRGRAQGNSFLAFKQTEVQAQAPVTRLPIPCSICVSCATPKPAAVSSVAEAVCLAALVPFRYSALTKMAKKSKSKGRPLERKPFVQVHRIVLMFMVVLATIVTTGVVRLCTAFSFKNASPRQSSSKSGALRRLDP